MLTFTSSRLSGLTPTSPITFSAHSRSVYQQIISSQLLDRHQRSMAAADINDLDQMFDDHPSLSASLEDFEQNDNRSPLFGLPSQHSGFKSEESEADAESSAGDPWSPPAWRRPNTGSGWYRHQPYLQGNPSLKPSASPSRSRETSPQYESAQEDEGDVTMPANIPLPRGSVSPVKERSPSPSPYPDAGEEFARKFGETGTEQVVAIPENHNNCTMTDLRLFPPRLVQFTDSW